MSTYAGTGSSGNIDGSASVSSFNGPRGLVFDKVGNLCVADVLNHKIRKIGDITTSFNQVNYAFDEISIFPNPASDALFIKNANDIDKYKLINQLEIWKINSKC